MSQAVAAVPALAAVDRLQRTSGFHFVDHVGRDARTLAGIEGITAQSYTVRSTLNAPLQEATEAALQEGLAATSSVPAGTNSRARRPISRMRSKRLNPMRRQGFRHAVRSGLAAGARGGTPAVIRRALAGRRCAALDPRQEDRRGHHACRPARRARAAFDGLERRGPAGLKPYDVVRVRVVEGTRAAGRPARNCAAGRTCRARRSCWRTRPAASSPWRAASPIRKPAQPRHAGPPPAGLGAEAADLSRRARTRASAQHARLGHARDSAARRGRSACARTGLLVAQELRWRLLGPVTLRRALENSKNLVTARLLDGAISSDPEQSLKRICELGPRSAALPRMRAALSLRARRSARAAHRSRGLLRRHRQRGRAADASRHRGRRGGRAHRLCPQAGPARAARLGRPGRLLSR